MTCAQRQQPPTKLLPRGPNETIATCQVLISSISGTTTYGGSTAKWEVRLGGTSKATNFDAQAPQQHGSTTTAAAPQQQLGRRRRNSNTTAAPQQQQATPLLVEYNRLHEIAISRGRAAPEFDPAARAALGRSLKRDRAFERAATYPLHVPGAPTPTASFASAPTWLFAHYPADLRHWVWQPTSPTPAPRAAPRAAPGASVAHRPPVAMLHMAGVRTGAAHRRALLRAHGLWDRRADSLLARRRGWSARPPLLGISPPDAPLPPLGPTETYALHANLMLLAALTGRVPMLPEIICPPAGSPAAAAWADAGRRSPERRLHVVYGSDLGEYLGGDRAPRCTWAPGPSKHEGCVHAQYVTAAEARAAADGLGADLGAISARSRPISSRGWCISSAATARSVRIWRRASRLRRRRRPAPSRSPAPISSALRSALKASARRR